MEAASSSETSLNFTCVHAVPSQEIIFFGYEYFQENHYIPPHLDKIPHEIRENFIAVLV
jgi:hypothetical protein